ncbi:hypothetical protein CDAR_415021 [Caerostris darwini]|uniref:Uncharacterized protein n=1 Tax=Caerostris darwini TaxID=1538125 RepID=A0AAV4TJQ4_9ARAC|nr:hypothetical protein CDAR_415021 [Caerostris darwini]
MVVNMRHLMYHLIYFDLTETDFVQRQFLQNSNAFYRLAYPSSVIAFFRVNITQQHSRRTQVQERERIRLEEDYGSRETEDQIQRRGIKFKKETIGFEEEESFGSRRTEDRVRGGVLRFKKERENIRFEEKDSGSTEREYQIRGVDSGLREREDQGEVLRFKRERERIRFKEKCSGSSEREREIRLNDRGKFKREKIRFGEEKDLGLRKREDRIRGVLRFK